MVKAFPMICSHVPVFLPSAQTHHSGSKQIKWSYVCLSVCLSPGERAPEGHPDGGAEAERQLPGVEFNSTEGETQTG